VAARALRTTQAPPTARHTGSHAASKLPHSKEKGSRVRITVLGKSPSWQDAGGACSGYLVEEDGTFLLVDCGNGVFSKLRAVRDYVAVDAVVVSHLHADHFLDLVPYAYALTYAPRQQPVPVDRWPGTDRPARPRLFAPRGARETFRRVVGSWGAEDLIENAFDLHEYDPAKELEVGPLRLRFHEVPHFLPTCAIDIRSTAGAAARPARFTYGADSAPTEELVQFARDTDLLMIEATLPRPERGGVRGHLTPGEAGDHGHRARARRLVITHFSDEMDELWARREAERTFGGPVSVAREGAVYEV
jgi:ribonuclease BN (tRNA processing enzyme)